MDAEIFPQFLNRLFCLVSLSLRSVSVPGLVSSDVALDDDGFLFEEPEVSPAEESPDVPLDGDSSPGLSAAPFVLQLLVEKLFEEHLKQNKNHTRENDKYIKSLTYFTN